MLRNLLNRFRPLSARPTRRAGQRIRNAEFWRRMVVRGGLSSRRADRYEATLRRRRLARTLGLTALAIFGAWVVIESAQALSMF